MKNHPGPATAVLVISAALAACGSTASSPTPSGSASAGASTPSASQPAAAAHGAPTDPCALVTEQEATTALGTDPGPGTARGTGASQVCEFSAGLFLQVGFNPGQNREAFDVAKTTVQSHQAEGAVVQELPGLGDANFVSSNPNGGGCYVLKGSVLGHMTAIARSPLAAPADAMISLCRTLGGRL